MRGWKGRLSLWLAALLAASLLGCGGQRDGAALPSTPALELVSPTPEQSAAARPGEAVQSADPKGNTDSLDQEGSYDGKEEVALYLRTYGELPDNYITKEEARDLGWNGGSVEDYAPGMCIGGDAFSNREGLLPKANGRVWTECDIDTLGEDDRGAKRIVYSNDGLIYYTDDHYEHFQLLYDGT